MLNGSVLGQKFYAARNPRWTKFGKAGKPLLGLRANSQVPGVKGIGNQYIQRRRFAETAMSLYNSNIKGIDPQLGIPNFAVEMMKRLGHESEEAKRQKYEARRASAHAAAVARWSGSPIRPGGGQNFGGYSQF